MAGRGLRYVSGVVVFSCVALFLFGCAPKVRVVPEETIQQKAMEYGKEEGFVSGFREGVKEGEKKAIERYVKEMEELRDYVLYYVMKEQDAVIPARVQRVYVSGSIDGSGTSYVPPHIEYVIVEQPKFNVGKLNEYLQNSGFRWILLASFSDKAEAYLAMSKAEKFSKTDYMEVMPKKGGNDYVLAVRVPADYVDRALAFYKVRFPDAQVLKQ